MNKNTKMITTGKEGLVLAKLTAPMTLGILGMIIFNLVDTYFVGKLGTVQLAALSFTFPVVMIIGSISQGLGVGMTAAVSKAAGEQNREKQIHLISWGMGLALIIVALSVLIGLMTIGPVFRALGADEETLVFISQYMKIWYWGVIFVIIPMTGNAAIRGMGDTKTPAQVMLIAAVLNILLDPLLIFGVGPFPEMGVGGAALATVLSRGVTFFVAWYILLFREKIISFRKRSFSAIKKAWGELLYVGAPNAFARIILPLGTGIITKLIATYGRESVAGFGIATRLEMFALILIQSMISITPIFVGQNWGAGLSARVIRGLKLANRFSLIYGAGMYLFFLIFARPIIRLFNDDPLVVSVALAYMRIVPLAYGLQGIMLTAVTTLNVLKKPVHSTLLTLGQMVLYVLLGVAGSQFFGIIGIFIALALSYLIMGPLSKEINSKYITREKTKKVIQSQQIA